MYELGSKSGVKLMVLKMHYEQLKEKHIYKSRNRRLIKQWKFDNNHGTKV